MWQQIMEGKTKLLVPERGKFGTTEKGRPRRAPVFYNPRAKLSRDVCCSVVRVLAKSAEVRFLDLLAGSGARGVRVTNEAGANACINDANVDAIEIIKKNAELNGVSPRVTNLPANQLLQQSFFAFNFIDVDPFGSPAPFLESAAAALQNSGCLAATATDTAALCGVFPKACFRKYSAVPLRCEFVHEVALRILLGSVARAAARHGKGVACLLSHSTEHYFRIYVRLREGKKNADKSLEELGYVYYCRYCLNREFERSMLPKLRFCDCGNEFEVAGPLWLGALKEQTFVEEAARESEYLEDKRLNKLLTAIVEEIEAPFYYDVHALSKKLKMDAPRIEELIQRLRDAGFAASRTHFSGTGFKTTASAEEVKKLMKK